jgi:hypothetical protein
MSPAEAVFATATATTVTRRQRRQLLDMAPPSAEARMMPMMAEELAQQELTFQDKSLTIRSRL